MNVRDPQVKAALEGLLSLYIEQGEMNEWEVVAMCHLVDSLVNLERATARQPAESHEPRAFNAKPLSLDKAGAPWPPSEDSKLARLFAEKKSISDIAMELSRTRGAVRSRLARLRLLPNS